MNPKIKKVERIALCGKRVNLVRGKNGIRKCQILFCGYYNDCANCNERQVYRRKSAIERVIYSYHDDLFREIIERDEWENLRHKLNYYQSEYIRVPQENNKYLIISSENVDGNFTAVSHTDVISELTSKDNLFAPGRRSTSRNWKLKQDKKEYSETIEIYELIPAFVPTKSFGELVTIEVTNQIFLHAATWKRGHVTFDNLQEYANHVANKAISLAVSMGIRWDMQMSRMAKVIVGKEELENWAICYVDEPNFTTQGDRSGVFDDEKYLLEINAIDPHDYVSDYIRSTKEDKLKEELGLAYDLFYPEHQYDVVEQADLDKVVVY